MAWPGLRHFPSVLALVCILAALTLSTCTPRVSHSPPVPPPPASTPQPGGSTLVVETSLKTLYLEDCNNNGIDDWRDIQDGTASDLNHNGKVDECDNADDGTQAVVLRTWRDLAHKIDTSNVAIRYEYPVTISACFTVPRQELVVAVIDSVDSARPDTVFVGVKPPGAYVLPWHPHVDHEAPLFAGRARVVFSAGPQRVVRRLAWDWTRISR